MTHSLLELCAWALALTSGVMAGVYFAFSSIIMRSLATLETTAAIATMNAVNTVILKTRFMPLFFGSTLIAVLGIGLGFWYEDTPGSTLFIAAGVIYTVGMFVVTATCNVPLNNALGRVGGDDDLAEQTWQHYLVTWTRWNTLRAVCCLTTTAISIYVLST